MNEQPYYEKLMELLQHKLPMGWIVKEDEEDKYTLYISLSTEENNGFTLRFRDVFERIQKNESEADRYLDELLERVDVLIHSERGNERLHGHEERIYPVLRHPSLLTKNPSNETLMHLEHTAESHVFYAYDLGKTYRLINQNMLDKEGWTSKKLHDV
ncbi:MAG: DUF1444 family protein, partial [Bacilli bacterium]